MLSTTQAVEISVKGGIDYGLSCALTGTEGAQRLGREKVAFVRAGLITVWGATVLALIGLWIWIMPFAGLLPPSLPAPRGQLALWLMLLAALEGLACLPWDLLWIYGQTVALSLRQGLFAPLRLLGAWLGSSWLGLEGCLMGYGVVGGLQLLWLWRRCDALLPWRIVPWRLEPSRVLALISAGSPLYLTNLCRSFVFVPLLAVLAEQHGLADLGFLRVGQIFSQAFTILPGALVPIFFLRLREADQVSESQWQMERSLLLLWWLGLFCLILYFLVDRWAVSLAFGTAFVSSEQSTRVLVVLTVIESLAQILHTALLASKRTNLFVIVEMGSIALAAVLGFSFMPQMGMDGYLLARLAMVLMPLLIYLWDAWGDFSHPDVFVCFLVLTLGLLGLAWLPRSVMQAIGWSESLLLLSALGVLSWQFALVRRELGGR
jgi:hypothetical protein